MSPVIVLGVLLAFSPTNLGTWTPQKTSRTDDEWAFGLRITMWGMRAKAFHRNKESRMSGNERVLEEIKTFLKALDSYPARFAANPEVTFEEHRASLLAFAQAASQGGQSKTTGKN